MDVFLVSHASMPVYFAVACVFHFDPLPPTSWNFTPPLFKVLLETLFLYPRIIPDPHYLAIVMHQPPPEWLSP